MRLPQQSRTDSWLRPAAWRSAGVLAASVALGFAFNASNPFGVRFDETDTPSLPTTTMPANQPSPPTQ